MNNINPEWVAIRTGSDGTNPWMDTLVFVAAENAKDAAMRCSEAMASWFEGNYFGCFGDALLDSLMLADFDFACHFCIYNAGTDEPCKEWLDAISKCTQERRIVYHAYASGITPVLAAA